MGFALGIEECNSTWEGNRCDFIFVCVCFQGKGGEKSSGTYSIKHLTLRLMHFIKIGFFFPFFYFEKIYLYIYVVCFRNITTYIYIYTVCVLNQNWSLCWEEMVAIGGPLCVSVQTLSEKQILSLKTNTVVFYIRIYKVSIKKQRYSKKKL